MEYGLFYILQANGAIYHFQQVQDVHLSWSWISKCPCGRGWQILNTYILFPYNQNFLGSFPVEFLDFLVKQVCVMYWPTHFLKYTFVVHSIYTTCVELVHAHIWIPFFIRFLPFIHPLIPFPGEKDLPIFYLLLFCSLFIMWFLI